MDARETQRSTQLEQHTGKGLIAYFAANPVASNVLMLVLGAGGILSGLQLAVNHYPDLDPRFISVSVIAPGSSAQEVEQDVNRRVEENVIGLPGVDRVVATARGAMGRVDIEVAAFANPDAVLRDVRNAVDRIENFPPPNAERPDVRLGAFEPEVLTLAVASSLLDEDQLRSAAEQTRRALLELPSVSVVKLVGTRDREISIELSEEELRRNDLTISQVASTVQRSSLNLTFGELHTEGGGVVLHTVDKRDVGEEFESIPLLTRLDGTIVTLGEIAEIRDAFVDADTVSTVDGVPSVLVRVEATSSESVISVSQDIRAWLERYEAPAGVRVSIWNDNASSALGRLTGILQNGVIGAVLVLIVLLLVFDLRTAFWITVGIPFSFFAALIFFEPAGLTLNLGTLIAFFLMIGLVVDDAVVVGESIAAERESGKSALSAAVSGVKSVAGPIAIASVTTVLAFVPFLFITEVNYQLLTVFPYVAFFVLAVSLVEAFLILPSHLCHERGWSLWPLTALQARVSNWIDEVRERTVVPVVVWSIQHFKGTLAIGCALVLVAVLLIRTDLVRLILYDQRVNAGDRVQVNLQLPLGTPFETTRAAAEDVATAVHAISAESPGESIKSVSVLAGQIASSRSTGADLKGSHLASVIAELNPRPIRVLSSEAVERAWRERLGDVSHLESIEFYRATIQTRPSVAYSLRHEDEETLEEAAAELTSFLSKVPGLYQITDSLALGKRHLEVELTPVGQAAGLSTAAIGLQLRASFHGLEAQRIQRGHEELKVMVRFPRERRQHLKELSTKRVRRVGGGEMPLSQVATLTESRQRAVLTRIDGTRAGMVSARADPTIITPIQARRRVESEFLPDLLDRVPGLKVEGEGGVRDERSMLRVVSVTVPVILLAMYALMAAFLRSYWKPLVAVAGIPISFAGAILGHWALGWDLTAMSLFGIIAVFGVVVNDALVLMDRYNTIRLRYPAMPAIVVASSAAQQRFRAVLLTSATTLLGLAPLLYERSEELLFLVPFVVSLMGGIVLSGVFILFVLPTLVMIIEGRRESI